MNSTHNNKSDRKIIFNLSFPAVMQTVMRSMFIIIDAYWVGKLGSQPLAALTVATFIVWGVIALGEVIATGTNSLVAQASGAKSGELARNISTENIVNSLVYTFIVGLCIVPALPFLYGVINLSPDIAALADEYLKVFLYGLPAILVLSTVTAIFRGYEDTKTPFHLLFIALALNLFLAPLFIFGINGFLKWGIAGSAVSTLISFLSNRLQDILYF
jgi:Na+-driven multidrug efflux pump